jgi:hypothetical protein
MFANVNKPREICFKQNQMGVTVDTVSLFSERLLIKEFALNDKNCKNI